MPNAGVGAALQELLEAQRGYDAAIAQLSAARRAPEPITHARSALLDAAASLVRAVNALDAAQMAFDRALAALNVARQLARAEPGGSEALASLDAINRAVMASQARLRAAGRVLRDARERA